MPDSKDVQGKKVEQKPILAPALRELGTTNCPVCGTRVTAFLTKTNRPFVNCSFCSVRIFYNGRESMRRLKRKMDSIVSWDV
jgi:hypothetical protein